MINKIEIMGVSLCTDSAKDILTTIDEYLNNNVMNLVVATSMRMLMLAEMDDGMRDRLNNYDIALPGEVGILKQANVIDDKLEHEIVHNVFFAEFMRLACKQKKTFFLIGDSQNERRELTEFIDKYYPHAQVVGTSCLQEKTTESIVNSINVAAPDVILSVIPSPKQEEFIAEQKSMIHAKVWYGLNDTYKLRTGLRAAAAKVSSMLHHLSFKRLMANYHKGKEEK